MNDRPTPRGLMKRVRNLRVLAKTAHATEAEEMKDLADILELLADRMAKARPSNVIPFPQHRMKGEDDE